MKLTKKIFGNIVMNSIRNNTIPDWNDYDITREDALTLMKKWCNIVEMMNATLAYPPEMHNAIHDWNKIWNEIVGE